MPRTAPNKQKLTLLGVTVATAEPPVSDLGSSATRTGLASEPVRLSCLQDDLSLSQSTALVSHNHEYNKLNMRGLPDNVLDNFEPIIVNAAIAEANNPQNVPLGELRQIDKFDSNGNLRERRFIGQECFVKFSDYGNRLGRRVVSFLTPNGHVDGSGRAFR